MRNYNTPLHAAVHIEDDLDTPYKVKIIAELFAYGANAEILNEVIILFTYLTKPDLFCNSIY